MILFSPSLFKIGNMKHLLSLEVPDTLNRQILRIQDTSVYGANMPVDCKLLEITLPGFSYSVQIGDVDLTQGFSLNLTACDLEIQTENCGTSYLNLPDGIYVIRYSVSPNEYVYVEYNHLRITNLLNCYQRVLCDIDIGVCEPEADKAKKLETLRKIKMYIEAAKVKAEVCHEPIKAMELYTYTKKLLGKFECTSCY